MGVGGEKRAMQIGDKVRTACAVADLRHIHITEAILVNYLLTNDLVIVEILGGADTVQRVIVETPYGNPWIYPEWLTLVDYQHCEDTREYLEAVSQLGS